MKILASVYLLESFTWILIQILYVHGHFKDYTWIWNHTHVFKWLNSHTELAPPVDSVNIAYSNGYYMVWASVCRHRKNHSCEPLYIYFACNRCFVSGRNCNDFDNNRNTLSEIPPLPQRMDGFLAMIRHLKHHNSRTYMCKLHLSTFVCLP